MAGTICAHDGRGLPAMRDDLQATTAGRPEPGLRDRLHPGHRRWNRRWSGRRRADAAYCGRDHRGIVCCMGRWHCDARLCRRVGPHLPAYSLPSAGAGAGLDALVSCVRITACAARWPVLVEARRVFGVRGPCDAVQDGGHFVSRRPGLPRSSGRIALRQTCYGVEACADVGRSVLPAERLAQARTWNGRCAAGRIEI